MTSVPVTTPEVLRVYAGETGIPIDQLELVVAKSALIRHLASNPETRDLFIVKGGTLLYHVYRGPRVSFKDVDFARPNSARIGASELSATSKDEFEELAALEAEVIEAMTIETAEFVLETREGRVNLDHVEMIEVSRIPFTITGLKRREGMKLTVSVRRSERVGAAVYVAYTDELLAENQTFDVSGLSIEELAAEKILGWVLRRLPKHYVDLAIIGHRYGTELDQSEVVRCLGLKVESERSHPELRRPYDYNEVRSLGDLAQKFDDPARAGALHAAKFEEQLGTEIVLNDRGNRHIDGLEDVRRVKELVSTHWQVMLDELK